MYKGQLFVLLLILLFSCYKDSYKDTYDPPVPANTPPYSLNELAKFENGQGDTITFKCTRHQNEEYISTYSCKDQNHCYIRDHRYRLLVDLTSSDNSRSFYFQAASDGVALTGYINNTPNFTCSHIGYNSWPFSGPWKDSIVLNGKNFYDYTEVDDYIVTTSDPYIDTIRYSRQDGIIMFSFRNQPMNLEERWVLVK